MTDHYENHSPSLVSPATGGANVAPSDDADLAQVTRAFYVGRGGDLSLRLVSGSQVVLAGVVGGTLLPLRAERVLATGTTAADIVALW